MARLHLAFRNIHPRVVEAADTLFSEKPWRFDSDEDRVAAGTRFLKVASFAYDVPVPELTLIEGDPDTLFTFDYLPTTGSVEGLTPPQILLAGWSITNLFVAFRVHLLYHGQEQVGDHDPLKWACSLFYAVRPVMFRARAREGRIVGVEAVDTYSTQTWERMKEVGVVSENDTLLLQNFNPADLDRYADGVDEVTEEDLAAIERHANGEGTEDDDTDDGLDDLGIVELRRLGSGRGISGMWDMNVTSLRAALRQRGIRP